uniref:Wiskott-Aldrich syndrome protein family member n=1 Tax=Corethrella appendiculata TaxID=1370023 RepID=U5EPY8_9DIPT
MPLPKRLVEPIFVARSVYARQELPAELETVTNTTLTNIVRQLSSLSKHSEDLFGELARDAGNLAERANSLQARIDRLAIKVTQLDSTGEEVSLQDIQLKKAFKSATVFDQQIFSRATMPTAMLETYNQCDKPPPLDKLNCYRDDGKDGLKFYTDPNYFFELWRQEMLKDTERMMHDRGKQKHKQPRAEGAGGAGGQRHKKRVRAPHNTREKQRQIAIGHGETLMPNNVIYRTPNSIINNNEEAIYNSSMGGNMIYDAQGPPRPNSIELRRSYQPEGVDGYAPSSPQYNHQTNNYPVYDENMYNAQQMYQGQMNIVENPYAPGTPSRGNSKSRPSQPPPAPPSSGSGDRTPNVSNANTPTRGRSMSAGRDALPPPPPIPEGLQSPQLGNSTAMHNGGSNAIATKLLGRSHSTSRAGSPQLNSINNQGATDQNQLVMSQLNQQINNLNAMNMQLNQMSINDLPPPPPIPEQLSPKQQSPPHAAPPPPPPPPPIDEISPQSTNNHSLTNGDIMNTPNGNILMGQPHQIQPKKVQSTVKPLAYEDPRTDLMKAIRDGIKLRKVEKQHNDAKEYERSKGLHDVASILARRVAIELSESESSESDEDSEGWIEPNETSA